MDKLLSIRGDGESLASCALWWSATPHLDGKRIGYIGKYERTDARAADQLLTTAFASLAKAGCDMAIGPIDGDTWHRYRFITERGTRAPFLLEPDNPDEYVEDFKRAGFTVVARYCSAEEDDLTPADPRAAHAAARLSASGIRIRKLDLSNYAADLDAMYDVATIAFARNAFFTPITRDAFHTLYAPLRAAIDPAYVRIAEHDGRAVAFAFGLLDAKGDAIVGKTQARLPDLRYAGLGAVLLDDVRRTAHERGVPRIIHALIADDNIAINGSRRTARRFRGYALFGRALK